MAKTKAEKFVGLNQHLLLTQPLNQVEWSGLTFQVEKPVVLDGERVKIEVDLSNATLGQVIEAIGLSVHVQVYNGLNGNSIASARRKEAYAQAKAEHPEWTSEGCKAWAEGEAVHTQSDFQRDAALDNAVDGIIHATLAQPYPTAGVRATKSPAQTEEKAREAMLRRLANGAATAADLDFIDALQARLKANRAEPV